MITVACVWVKGNVPFTADYVTRLKSMVGKHLASPHRFVCLTDRPEKLPPMVDHVKIAPTAPLPGWWAKVQLFNRAHGFTGRMMYLDLDTLIVDDLEPVATYPASFALVPHAGNFEGKFGLRVVKKYNSSVMVWNADRERIHELYDDWTPGIARRLWGDQDWIAETFPYEKTMPLEWFPRVSELPVTNGHTKNGSPWSEDAKVVLCKRPKNHEAAHRWEWFRKVWR